MPITATGVYLNFVVALLMSRKEKIITEYWINDIKDVYNFVKIQMTWTIQIALDVEPDNEFAYSNNFINSVIYFCPALFFHL